MSYIISEHNINYSLIVKSAQELIINGKIHFIDPMIEDLDDDNKKYYYSECLKNIMSVISFKNLDILYNDNIYKLDDISKKNILLKSYINSKLNNFFPGIINYIDHNQNISLILSTIIFNLLNNKLPRSPYNIGLIFKKGRFNKIGCVGYKSYLKVPSSITKMDSFDLDKILY